MSALDTKLESSLKKDYFWNTLGSLMSAASSVVLLFATIRVLGDYWAGVFSIAFAVGQQFQTLGAFEMRPIQSTDVKKDYSFATYLASRILTTALMLFCIIGYACFTNEYPEEILMVILIASLKMFDAFEDVFHGAFQQNNRLDVAGRAFFFRSLVTTVTFICALAITGNLISACIVTITISAVALAVLNIKPAITIVLPSGPLVIKAMFKLLLACLPLFLGAFLAMYLSNAPKFALDSMMPKEYQAYYAALFMPALAINLLSAFVFRPLLTRLAYDWINCDKKSFLSKIINSLMWISLAFVLVFVVSYFVGIPILNIFFDLSLDAYKNELLVLIVGGGLNAIGVIFYYGLVVMRKQIFLLSGYAIVALVAFILANHFVSALGLTGACMLYVFVMGLVALMFMAFFVVFFRVASPKI